MLPLGHIIHKHGLSYHFYADDTQLDITLKNRTSTEAITILLNCLHDIKAWMQQNFLQLNCAKTEVILIENNTTLSPLPDFTFKIDNVKVIPSSQFNLIENSQRKQCAYMCNIRNKNEEREEGSVPLH